MSYGRDEQAGLGFGRNDCWAGVAAREQRLSAVNAKTALELLRGSAVAFVAVFRQDRTDFCLEEFLARARRTRGSGCGKSAERKHQHGEPVIHSWSARKRMSIAGKIESNSLQKLLPPGNHF